MAWAAAGRALRPVAEAEARERAFVCIASHDLVTPLMAVTANCDVLEAEAFDQGGLASWVANMTRWRLASLTCSCACQRLARAILQRALLSGKRLIARHAGVRA